METPAVEMEEGGAGVEVDYFVVDAEAASVQNEKEVEEGEGVRSVAMEDDAGAEEASSVVVSAAATVVVEVDMVEHKGKERRDPGGRKKRKERESGGGEGEDGEVKEDRKKRRDEKERRKGRDAVEGSEKREHREGRERKDDRKDAKRKKDRKDKKERREEKDGKYRKNIVLTEEDGWEQLERREKDGRLEKQVGESHRRETMDHDAVVCHERRTSRSMAETEDQMLVENSVGTHGRKSGFAVESVVKASLLDDDKEEGEILDEESGPAGVAESETESGEIQTLGEIRTLDDSTLTGADMTEVAISVHDSLGGIERSRWNSPPVEALNSLSEHSMLDRNGKSSNKDAQEKLGQAAPPNPLQSMLVIAEAYDSESPASEDRNAFPSAVRVESRRNYNRKTENGSRKSELSELDRKSGVEKSKAQDKDELKSYSMGPFEQRSNESKDRKVFNVEDETRSKPEDNKVRSSRRNEARSGNNSERGEVKEQPIVDRPKSLVTRTSDSPEIEDSGHVGRNRADDSRRHRSPSPKEVPREKDHRRGRSRSKERRSERGRSRSLESTKGREYNRRRTRSPELARERSSRKGRSPSRESLRDRRTVLRESTERRKRSRSRDSGPERRHSRDKAESVDRRRRSRSRESGRVRALARVDSVDKRRRSRSRESPRDKNRDVSRRADSVERRRRSSSRSIRDRRIEDRITSRHSDVVERRRRSRSRDSLRDRKVDDRDSGRLGRRGDDSRHRSGRDDRRDDRNFHDGSRDSNYRTDRDRDRNYSNLHDKDLQSKGSQQSARDSMAAEAIREEENQEEYQERVASQLAAQEEDDVDRIKEESRKRRQAILEKYKKQRERPEQPILTEQGHMANGIMADVDVPPLLALPQKHLSPVLVSAPSDVSLSLGKLPNQNGALPLAAGAEAGGLGAGSPKSERSADMFCDDIFGESPAGGRRLGKGDGLAMDTSGLIDNWDDAEGYYCFRIGEVLDGRYEVASSHGRGVFSTVVRARDMKAGRGEPEEVAIKIIRNNETMYKAGQQELVILKKLAGADPENKRHCVRLLSSFEYRSHLCLVFESLHMNLREILKKFGRNIGINLNAVRAYAKQLFISLKHLRNCGVLHCDIKPDNMLVNESKNVLKLCDFGSAMFAGENEITPYLVSRFYRAPEIILGLPYDHALDIWSVGCCLYELYTGKMLFPGHTNNDMLRLHMELKGPFPKKMLKKAAFADQHFDQDFNFCAIEEDPVTKKAIKRILANVKPRDMGILVSGSGTIDEDSQMLSSFKDLLEKIFILDPDRRLTVSQALSHSFISGK